MENPLISIIIPVYGVEPFLRDCIESCRRQTYRNLEIILIDDGSDIDNCPEICDEYAIMDDRVRTYHKENQGVWSARNLGIEKMCGEYVIFLDADDILHFNAVEIAYKTLKKYDVDVVTFARIDINESEQLDNIISKMEGLSMRDVPKPVYKGGGHECFKGIWDMRTKYLYEVLWNKLYSAKYIKKFRFVENHYEDQIWLSYVYESVPRWCTIEMPLYFYRIRKNSAIHSSEFRRCQLDSFISKDIRRKVVKNSGDRELLSKATRECLKQYVIILPQIPSAWEDYDILMRKYRVEYREKYRNLCKDLILADKIFFGLYYLFPGQSNGLYKVYKKVKALYA